MKTINLNTYQGCKSLLFPDNQPHITLTEELDNETIIICSITDSKKLLELCMLTDILSSYQTYKVLHIPYLMGARYDRRMNIHESFDLKVIANIINSLKYDGVVLYDAHSDVATGLIDRAANMDNKFMVDEYERPNSILIVPDAGAAKKAANYPGWNPCITGVVYCIKHRDTSTGNLQLKVMGASQCEGRNCVIIDDLCDGGGTFNMIADQIKPDYLTLVVTHGIFSKGFGDLSARFDQIITSNSYNKTYNCNILRTVKIHGD